MCLSFIEFGRSLFRSRPIRRFLALRWRRDDDDRDQWGEGYQAEAHRVAGEIALMSAEPDVAKAEKRISSTRSPCPCATSKVLGTERRDDLGAATTRSG
jgi:hypothetical protein